MPIACLPNFKILRKLSVLVFLSVIISADLPAQTKNMQASVNQFQPEQFQQKASPDWGKQQIYFVMLDRFSDGDVSNNDQGQNEFDVNKDSHFQGGDLIGLIEQLDYIQSMGFTAVWITPPVLNQWWSPRANYGGYHGYWAKNFTQVDPHFGTLEDYKKLAQELHKRDMYLIQDIVLNHTGIFFNYENGIYDASNTATNFSLSAPFSALGQQDKTPLYDAPTQAPFDQINRLNPKHHKADIYHWTPELSNFASQTQEYTYQLGGLADINTENEAVIAALKESYKYWIKEVGVDAFRIDTVKYVPHEFWHRFLHDDDGIYAFAESLGKSHFLTFGEVFQFSTPLQNDGEDVLKTYLNANGLAQLNSVINFPLYNDVNTVFAQGAPTEHLAYRMKQHMTAFDNPRTIPTFIDNHDTPRFLAGGSPEALEQALVLIYTLPGVPVIYQGTEQLFTQTRQRMFSNSALSKSLSLSEPQFNSSHAFVNTLRELSNMRSSNDALTDGLLTIVKSDTQGAGVLAYEISNTEQTLLVVMNTSERTILSGELKSSLPANKILSMHYQTEGLLARQLSELGVEHIATNSEQTLQVLLPPRAIIVLSSEGDEFANNAKTESTPFSVSGLQKLHGQTLTSVKEISGASNRPNATLQFITNGDWDKRLSVNTDHKGGWQYKLNPQNLGVEQLTLSIFDSVSQSMSTEIQYTSSVTKPQIEKTIVDPKNDDTGQNGQYLNLLHSQSGKQRDILSTHAQAAGNRLILSLSMQDVSDVWAPANGFDNVSFSLFFNLPDARTVDPSQRSLPLLNANMPDNQVWHFGHVAFGWGNYLFNAKGASALQRGQNVGAAPFIKVDKHNKTISFTYHAEHFDIENWDGVSVYITTWDISGEGNYREIAPKASQWIFGGGEPSSARILDDLWVPALHKTIKEGIR